MKGMSFTHPHIVPNLYDFLSYNEHKKRYCEEFKQTMGAPKRT